MTMTKKNIRTYQELITFKTFEERLGYLKLDGVVGRDTFGFDRYMNQMFYKSKEWKDIRNQVIVRDSGRDLAFEGQEIFGRIYIHHMNPINPEDIKHSTDFLLNPDYLVCASFDSHQFIHYGIEMPIYKEIERQPNDCCPWR